MKRIKKYLSIYLSIFIVLCNIPLFQVNATVTQNVFSTSTISVGGVNITAYEYDDPSILPDSKMVYWVEDSAVVRAPLNDIYTVLLNKRFGLAIKPNYLSNFIAFINANLWGSGADLISFFNGSAGFVSKNGTIVGVALDNLTNYSLKSDNNYTSLSVPSTIVNNTWNNWNNFIERYPQTTPYFVVEPMKPFYFDVSTTYNDEYETIIDNKVRNLTSNQVLFCAKDESVSINDHESAIYQIFAAPNSQWGRTSCKIFDNINTKVAVHNTSINSDNMSWTNFCNNFNLNENNTTLKYYQLKNQTVADLFLNFYNSSDLSKDNSSISFQQTGSTSSSTSSPSLTHQGSYPVGSTCFTVYKDIASVNDITNNTYQKNYYTSTTTNNFNTNNDNTTIINNEQINNSQSTNNNIYNQSQSTTNNNNTENNYNIDNSQNDNSVTTIINNYYGDSSGGDSGGGGDDDDDDDDSIWDALLKALGDFIKKIGELLATILTGIISICTSVLDAIASIAESFTGITDFIGSIFAFIPSDIVAVLTLGITLAVLISLIKIFRG